MELDFNYNWENSDEDDEGSIYLTSGGNADTAAFTITGRPLNFADITYRPRTINITELAGRVDRMSEQINEIMVAVRNLSNTINSERHGE